MGPIDDRAIGGDEAHPLDPVVGVAKRAGELDAVLRTRYLEHQTDLVDVVFDQHVRRRDSRVELDDIVARLVRPARVADHVLPEPAAELVNVADVAAAQEIVAGSTGDDVGAAAPGQRIVPRAAVEHGGVVTADEVVVAVGRSQRPRRELGVGPISDRTIGGDEAHAFDPVVAVAERAGELDAVFGARYLENDADLVGVVLDDDVRRRDGRVELDDVVARLVCPARVADDVLPEPTAEFVDVADVAAAQEIVAVGADQHICAAVAGKRIVAPPAGQRVRIIVTGEREVGRRGERRTGEVDQRQRARGGVAQARNQPRVVEPRNPGRDEIDRSVSPFLARDDVSGEARREAYIENIACIAGLEIGHGYHRAVVERRHEQPVGIDPGGAGENLRAGSDDATVSGPATRTAAARSATGHGAEQRIDERIRPGGRRMQQRFGGIGSHRPGEQCGRVPDGAAGKHDAIDRRAGGGRLAEDRNPVAGRAQAQDDIVARTDDQDIAGCDPRTELEHVVRARPVGRFGDGVASAADAELVGGIAQPAREPVIARAASKRCGNVERGAQVDGVVARGTRPQPRIDVAERPQCAVGELDQLDRMIGRRSRPGEEVGERDPLVPARQGNDEIARSDFGEADVGGGDPRGKPQPVELGFVGLLEIDDHVLAVAAREEIDVRARLPLEPVISDTAGEDVGPAAPFDPIVAEPAIDVRSRSAARVDRCRRCHDMVVAIGFEHACRQLREAQRLAVGEADRADHRIGVAQRLDERDPVVAAHDRQHEVAVAVALGNDVRAHNPRAEFEHGLAIDASARLDPVLAIAAVEAEHVVAAVADQDVAARAAGEHFAGRSPDETVVARRALTRGAREQRIAAEHGAIGEDNAVDAV